MSNTREIIDGYTNLAKAVFGVDDKFVEDMHKERIAHCNSCRHKTAGGRCDLCGCLLEAKTRSMGSKCPDGKWHEKSKL